MENVKRINKYLEDQYGRALDNKPKFRVAFSNDLFEVRTGNFERYTESGIYLGSFNGTQKAPKYTYIRDKYILEVYTRAFPEAFGGAIRHSSDIIQEGDGYEPLRVFQTKDRKFLPPREDVCKIICDSFVELINRPQARRITQSIALNDEMRELDAETRKFEEILNASDSDLLQKFKYQEAIVLPGKDLN